MAFSPGGTMLATGAVGGNIFCTALHLAADALAFLPDGATVAGGDRRGVIHLWNAQNGEPQKGILEGHTGAVADITVAAAGASRP